MTIEEVITVLAMQEEILQFGHFTNEDAWALGNLIVAEARKRGLDTAVEIRLNNGYTVFKYAGNSTNLNNEAWMDKMYATVLKISPARYFEDSSKDHKLFNVMSTTLIP